MSAKPNKTAQLLANILIVILVLVIGAGLAKRFIFAEPAETASETPPSDAQLPELNSLSKGDKVRLTGVDWAKNHRTVLLAFSPDCHFCNESLPFYRKLTTEAAKQKNVRIIGVSPDGAEESKKFLDYHEVLIQDVRQAPLKSIGLQFTPTLVLVDDAGIATDVLMGQLPADAEGRIMNWVKGGSADKSRR